MGRLVWTLLLLVIALLTASAASVVLGARLLADLALPLSPQISVAVAGVAGLLVTLVVPGYIASRLIARLSALAPHRPTITLGTVFTCNALILGATLGLMGPSTAEDLRTHGSWFLAGNTSEEVQQTLSLVADRLPGAAPSAPVAPVAPEVPDPGVSELPAPVPDVPMTAKEVFAARSPSIVVVRTWAPLQDDMMKSIMRAFGMERVEGQGSAFAIAPDRLVTNHHVIGSAEQAEVVMPDGRVMGPVELLALDPTNDLALVRVPGASFVPIPLSDGSAAVGDPCFAIGAPLGMEQTLTEGIVSARREMNGTRVVQMQTPIAPGSSGSPLLDDRGRVIGVNTATYGAGMNLAVDLEHINALLTKVAPDGAPVRKLDLPAPHLVLDEITVEGEMLPTERQQMGQIGAMLAGVSESCLGTLDADARVDLAVSSLKLSLTSSTLPEAAATCLKGQVTAAAPLGFFLSNLFGSKVAAVDLAFTRHRPPEVAPVPAAPVPAAPAAPVPAPEAPVPAPVAPAAPESVPEAPPAAVLTPVPVQGAPPKLTIHITSGPR